MSNKKQFSIITHANAKVGFGHLSRCLALSSMLEDEFDHRFLLWDSEGSAKKMGIAEDALIEFESPDQIVSFLAGEDRFPDLIGMDSYDLDPNFVGNLQRRCPVPSLSINDLPEQVLPTPLIINHSMGIEPTDFDLHPRSRLLLGPEYLLLRQEFLSYTEEIKSGQKQILLAFGGSDPSRTTYKCLKYLQQLECPKPIVVLSNSAEVISEIKDSDFQFEAGLSFKSALSAGQMIAEFANSLLCLLPSSTISMEAMLVGSRLLIGLTADNQELIHNGILAKNLAVSIGDYRSITFEEFALGYEKALETDTRSLQIQTLRQNSSEHIRSAVAELYI